MGQLGGNSGASKGLRGHLATIFGAFIEEFTGHSMVMYEAYRDIRGSLQQLGSILRHLGYLLGIEGASKGILDGSTDGFAWKALPTGLLAWLYRRIYLDNSRRVCLDVSPDVFARIALPTGLLGWLSRRVCLDGSPDGFACMALRADLLGSFTQFGSGEGQMCFQ